MSEHANLAIDYYKLLGLPRSPAPAPATLKSAYHAALLRHHPDKNKSAAPAAAPVDVDLLRAAYQTLRDPVLRAAHDRSLSSASTSASAPARQRPADFVSLDEFEEDKEGWTMACRCSGVFRIDEEQMNAGVHVVGCNGCSEVVWVGYETAEDG